MPLEAGRATGTCTDACGAECSLTCSTACYGACSEGCSTACLNDCTGTCTDACGAECSLTCSTACVGGCTATCSAACADDCMNTCSNSCGGDCVATCAADCSATCTGSSTDTTPPGNPVSLTGTSTDTSITLSWGAATDNVGVTGYNIYSGSTLKGNTTGISYTIGGLLPVASYTYTVKAKDAAGNESSGASITIDIPIPVGTVGVRAYLISNYGLMDGQIGYSDGNVTVNGTALNIAGLIHGGDGHVYAQPADIDAAMTEYSGNPPGTITVLETDYNGVVLQITNPADKTLEVLENGVFTGTCPLTADDGIFNLSLNPGKHYLFNLYSSDGITIEDSAETDTPQEIVELPSGWVYVENAASAIGITNITLDDANKKITIAGNGHSCYFQATQGSQNVLWINSRVATSKSDFDWAVRTYELLTEEPIDISIDDYGETQKIITVRCDSAKNIKIEVTKPGGTVLPPSDPPGDEIQAGMICDLDEEGVYQVEVTVTDPVGAIRVENRQFEYQGTGNPGVSAKDVTQYSATWNLTNAQGCTLKIYDQSTGELIEETAITENMTEHTCWILDPGTTYKASLVKDGHEVTYTTTVTSPADPDNGWVIDALNRGWGPISKEEYYRRMNQGICDSFSDLFQNQYEDNDPDGDFNWNPGLADLVAFGNAFYNNDTYNYFTSNKEFVTASNGIIKEYEWINGTRRFVKRFIPEPKPGVVQRVVLGVDNGLRLNYLKGINKALGLLGVSTGAFCDLVNLEEEGYIHSLRDVAAALASTIVTNGLTCYFAGIISGAVAEAVCPELPVISAIIGGIFGGIAGYLITKVWSAAKVEEFLTDKIEWFLDELF